MIGYTKSQLTPALPQRRLFSSSMETLHNIIYRCCVPTHPGTLMLCTSVSPFKTIVAHISIESWSMSPNYPLWFNPYLIELYSLPDPQRWSSKGVKYLCHLYTAQGFKSFHQLRLGFNLPPSYIFFYYQLRHAIRAQFGSLVNPLQIPPLEKMLRWSDPTKLIPVYYSALMIDSNHRFNAVQVKWTSLDIAFTEADWTEFSETYQKAVI